MYGYTCVYLYTYIYKHIHIYIHVCMCVRARVCVQYLWDICILILNGIVNISLGKYIND